MLIHGLMRQANLWCGQMAGRPARNLRRSLLMSLRDMGKILGVLKEEPEAFVQDHKMQVLRDLGITEEDILAAIRDRDQARQQKEWERSDRIREDMAKKGILLMDRADRTVWSVSWESL